MPGQYFRGGAGAVVVNPSGLVLALERSDFPGAWQLPQGGLESTEDPLAAITREIEEETGLASADLEMLDRYPEPLAYELPEEARTPKTGRGQVQYWFLFRFAGSDGTIDVFGSEEFRNWKWTTIADLLDTVVEFRLPVYRKLAERFAPHLAAVVASSNQARRRGPPR